MNSVAAVMCCKAVAILDTASFQIKLTHQLILRDRNFCDIGRYFGSFLTINLDSESWKDRPIDGVGGDQFILV